MKLLEADGFKKVQKHKVMKVNICEEHSSHSSLFNCSFVKKHQNNLFHFMLSHARHLEFAK